MEYDWQACIAIKALFLTDYDGALSFCTYVDCPSFRRSGRIAAMSNGYESTEAFLSGIERDLKREGGVERSRDDRGERCWNVRACRAASVVDHHSD